MWMIATFQQVSVFSLKSAMSTASGGKSLLIPTPFAIKMALLDRAIRSFGLDQGKHMFPLIRDLQLCLEPPDDMVVQKSFSKIQRPLKDMNDPEKSRRAQEIKQWPMQSTIAYREYVFYQGPFRLACWLDEPSQWATDLSFLLLQMNYLGKRGGFVQVISIPHIEQDLARTYVPLTTDTPQYMPLDGIPQILDDCGSKVSFDQVSVYSSSPLKQGKDRLLRHIVLPYHMHASSRSYSWYRREETE